MHHDREPGRDQERDRLEIPHRIERRPARRNRREHQRTAAAEQKGVAVGRRPRDRGGAQRTAGAADVLDHHGAER